jgi:uncharacterized protein YkwD
MSNFKVILFALLMSSFLSIAGKTSADENMLAIPTSKWESDFAVSVIKEVNAQRVAMGLGELEQNEALNSVAQQKVEDMVSRGYFSHNTPDGQNPWYWIQKNKIAYSLAGENLAVRFEKPQDVVSGWMNSPSHKKNVLNGGYTQTGVGVAKGNYEGKEAIFVVEFYLQPKKENTISNLLASYF